MNRKGISILVGVWVMLTLAGCAENDQITTRVAVSRSPNGAASGAAVSGMAASAAPAYVEDEEEQERQSKLQKKEIAKQRYANDRNIFEGDRIRGIYQYDLTGKEEKFYNTGREFGMEESDDSPTEVLWVENDWIFFSCQRDEECYEIWRAPLVRTKSKNRINFKKREKLLKVKRWGAFFTKAEHTIFYCADEKIGMLNLDTKKKRELDTGLEEWECTVVRNAEGIPFVQDGKVYYDEPEGKMYQVDLNRWEKKSIGVYSDGNIGTDGTSLYFMQEDFVKYNPRTGKKKKLFSGDKLEEMVEELKLPVTASSVVSDSSEVQDICTQAVFVRGDRIYLVVEAEYEGEETDEEGEFDDDDIENSGSYARILFSCKVSDGRGLRYEKEVTEYLWKHSIAYDDSYAESLWTEATGDVICFVDGCIVMHFYDENARGEEDDLEEEDLHRYVMYDLSEGTFWKVKKPSAEYGYIKATGFSYYEEAHC